MAVSLSKVMDLAQVGHDPAEDGQHRRADLGGRFAGKPGCQRDPGLAVMQDKLRLAVLADDQIAFPMTGFFSSGHAVRTFMD